MKRKLKKRSTEARSLQERKYYQRIIPNKKKKLQLRRIKTPESFYVIKPSYYNEMIE